MPEWTTIVEFFKLSKKTQVSILISCIIVIAIAQFKFLMEMLAITFIVQSLLPFVSILAIILLGFILGVPIYDTVDKQYITARYKNRMTEHLKKLANDEKKVLRSYVESENRVQYHDLEDGVIAGLSSKDILYRSSQVSKGINYTFAFGIQDMALDILKKHPEYLE